MFHSKRGEAVDILMHPAFVIFVAVLVLLYLLWFINGLGSDYTFEKKFLATDLALTVDSLLASKDNVILYYLPQSQDFTPRFTYSFEKNKITIFEDNKLEKNAGVYFFTSDPSVSIEESSLNFKEPFVLPRLAKIGNNLFIDDAHEKKYVLNPYLLSCPSKKITLATITLDPGHGYDAESRKGSTGVINKDLKEYVLTREIAGMARSLDTKKIFTELTRDADFSLSVENRKSRIKNAVVSIHVGSYVSNENFVKAYINYNSDRKDESLRLACELVNAVSSELIRNNFKITGIAVVPVIPEKKSDEQFEILIDDMPAVLLEIGNINVPETFDLKNKRVISAGIVKGVVNAYE